MHRDLRELAARAHRDRTGILLRAGHPIGKPTIDGEVIDLSRRLIEPRCPGDFTRILAAGVASNDRALIAGDDHRVGIAGGDPRLMVVVTARRSAQHDPGLAAVHRSVNGNVWHVDGVGIAWIHRDLFEIPASRP